MLTFDELHALKTGDVLYDISNPAKIPLTIVRVDWNEKRLVVKTPCGTFFDYGLYHCSKWPLSAETLVRR